MCRGANIHVDRTVSGAQCGFAAEHELTGCGKKNLNNRVAQG